MIGPVSNKLTHIKQILSLVQTISKNKYIESEQSLLSRVEPRFVSLRIMPWTSSMEERPCINFL
jgi:hypothetical protein